MSNNNILFYFSWQLRPVHHGIVIEKLNSILKSDPAVTVYFLICDGEMKPCYTNRTGDPAVCRVCRLHSSAALGRFGDRVKVVKVGRSKDGVRKSLRYESIDDIKALEFKGIKIGYGALSSYISFTRNLEPDFDEEFRRFFNALLVNQMHLTEEVLKLNKLHNFNKFIFFNGRTADTRPLYDLSVSLNIPFISLELIKKSDTEYYVNEFYNCLPHDIDFHHQRMLKTWENSALPIEKRKEAGAQFFKNRRSGILARDRKVYTSQQVENQLPEGWNNTKRNIAIFNSSEDEFAAIGDIFEKLAFFTSQEEGLKKILEAFKGSDEFVFYFRIHPNLSQVKYSYHTRLYKLQEIYPNLRIIGPMDSVSTYALIDATEKILVFGSSTGVEASYWGKPTILLAGSFYYHLDATYKPRTFEELISLIRNLNLPPKENSEAIKYGFYMMNYQDYSRVCSYSPEPLRILGFQLGLGFDHLKVLNSRLVFKTLDHISRKLIKFTSAPKYRIPVKEKDTVN